MEDLGHKLRHAREARGVSLREIATRTKISLATLEALERSEFHRLPGGIFSRALVRAYAIEVGLDPDTTVENFLASARRSEQELAARRAATRPRVTRDDREFLDRQRRALGMLRFAVVVIAAGAVAVLVWQMRRVVAPAAPAETPAAVAPVVMLPPPLPPDAAAAPGDEAPVESAAPDQTTPGTAATPRPPSPPAASDRAASTPPPSTAEPATGGNRAPSGGGGPAQGGGDPPTAAGADDQPAPSATPSGPAAEAAPPLVVELMAIADSELTVARDGGAPERQMVRAGERQRLTAAKEVDLTVADAGAFTWTINGKPAQPLGKPGASVRVRVTPANAEAYLP